VAALQVLQAITTTGKTLAQLRAGMNKLPQVLLNVPLPREGLDVKTDSAVSEASQRVESALQGRGRVLLRPSGTEPVIRVMVEGPDEAEIRHHAERLATVIRDA
jgi:phosphoglucosamine mutase